MARRLIIAENRMKMHANETPWGKYLRLNELARHRKRCQNMKCSIDASPPEQSPRQRLNREMSDLEQVLGGTSNWIGKYKPGAKKLSDCKPCSVPKVAKDNTTPFSSLKIQPQDGKNGEIKGKGRGNKGKQKKCPKGIECKSKKGWTINCGLPAPPKKNGKEPYEMSMHEQRLTDYKERIRKIQKGSSMYSPKKNNYLSRGECPWNYKLPEVHTIDEKLKEIRKWAMKHRTKITRPLPTGIMAYLPAIFFTPPPQPELESISPITEEDAKKSPQLAQLKEVQEAGDPNF